jgi:hypothetical protein
LVGVVVVEQGQCLLLLNPVGEVGVGNCGVWFRVVDCGDIGDEFEHGWLPSRYVADSVKPLVINEIH